MDNKSYIRILEKQGVLLDRGGKMISGYKDEIRELERYGMDVFLRENVWPEDEDLLFFSIADLDDILYLRTKLEKAGRPRRTICLVNRDISRNELCLAARLNIQGLIYCDSLMKDWMAVVDKLERYGFVMEQSFHHILAEDLHYHKQKSRPVTSFKIDPEKTSPYLDDNEQRVLELLVNGYSTAEIAHALYFAKSTVNTVVGRVLQKMDVSDRTCAVVKSIRDGWMMPQR